MSTALLTATSKRSQPHRWTVSEFNSVREMGWFEGRCAFLLDGVILEQWPIDPSHPNALELMTGALSMGFGSGWRFRIHTPLRIDTYNDPMLDIAVVAGRPAIIRTPTR